MTLPLSHLNLPARDPDGLAAWYAEHLGFERRGTYLVGPGTLLVFEAGEPLGARANTHFGFHVESPEVVVHWAQYFGTAAQAESGFAGTKVHDPEGNCFELYWELDGPRSAARPVSS
jgi:hypothetical protein